TWEYNCPVKLYAGMLRLKLEGFRQQWNAQLISEENLAFHFRLPIGTVPAQRSLSRSQPKRPVGLDVRLQFVQTGGVGPVAQIRDVSVHISAFGGYTEGVRELSPRVFQSLRAYLQATAEQRTGERYPYRQPVHVYPILPDLELTDVLK